MNSFLRPNRDKLLLWLGISVTLVGTLLFNLIPPSIDILDLHRIPAAVYTALGRWPIDLFDYLTWSRFRPKSESFLVFPSLAQLLFLVVFDSVLVYLVTCLVCYTIGRARTGRAE